LEAAPNRRVDGLGLPRRSETASAVLLAMGIDK